MTDRPLRRQDRRDPRFSALSGDLSTEKVSKSYGFVKDLQIQEAKAIRENIRQLRKEVQDEGSSARQQERAQKEINRLHVSLKRVENLIQKSRQSAREREVLKKVKKEEDEKRATGKKAWYLKDCTCSCELAHSPLVSDLCGPRSQRRRRSCYLRPSSKS